MQDIPMTPRGLAKQLITKALETLGLPSDAKTKRLTVTPLENGEFSFHLRLGSQEGERIITGLCDTTRSAVSFG